MKLNESVFKSNFINFNECTLDKNNENRQTITNREPKGTKISKFSKPNERRPISYTKRRKKIGDCAIMQRQLVLAEEAESLASRRKLLSEGSTPRRSVSNR